MLIHVLSFSDPTTKKLENTKQTILKSTILLKEMNKRKNNRFRVIE